MIHAVHQPPVGPQPQLLLHRLERHQVGDVDCGGIAQGCWGAVVCWVEVDDGHPTPRQRQELAHAGAVGGLARPRRPHHHLAPHIRLSSRLRGQVRAGRWGCGAGWVSRPAGGGCGGGCGGGGSVAAAAAARCAVVTGPQPCMWVCVASPRACCCGDGSPDSLGSDMPA